MALNTRESIVLLVFVALLGASQDGLSQQVAQAATARRIVGVSYPRLAKLGRIEGEVALSATISTKGKIENIRVITGHELLVDAARKALLASQFACVNPAQPCEVKVLFEFELLDEACDNSCCSDELIIDLPNKVTVRAKHMPPMID